MRLGLLHELTHATLIAYFTNPSNPVFSETETREVQRSARALGVRLLVLKVGSPGEFESAFTTLVDERAGGLLVGGDLFFANQSELLVSLTARHRVPAVYHRGEIAKVGGLMSYGAIVTDAGRLAGTYAGRILKGEKPSDLPVQQSTKIELTINLKTAKALGLTIPETLLATADEVIQ
jgi:putative ABC transport system substrate-binding protein